jgi:hypothetical protein
MVDNDTYREKFLKCPFCLLPICGPPRHIDTPFGDTVEGGGCGCGAVFVFDRTGRMLGEAFMNCLAFAFDWNYERAVEAGEGSYEEAVVMYDKRFKKFMLDDGGRFDRQPKFYFVRRLKAGGDKNGSA